MTFIIAFCVALIILCGIGSVIMKFNEPKLDIDSEEHKGIKISDYIEPRMNSISLVSILVGFAYSGVIGFMAAYTKDLNLILAGTFFFVVYAVVITITRPLLGIVFDMKGENFVFISLFRIFSAWYFLTIHCSLYMACTFIRRIRRTWIWYIHVKWTSGNS